MSIPGFIREARPDEFPDRARVEGWRIVVVDELAADANWRARLSTSRCRFMVARKGCGRPAVVELNRGVWKRGPQGVRHLDYWWGYCPEHLFGRTWVDGRLEGTRLVHEDEQP